MATFKWNGTLHEVPNVTVGHFETWLFKLADVEDLQKEDMGPTRRVAETLKRTRKAFEALGVDAELLKNCDIHDFEDLRDAILVGVGLRDENAGDGGGEEGNPDGGA